MECLGEILLVLSQVDVRSLVISFGRCSDSALGSMATCS